LGDISGTIKATIEKAQAPVNAAIDWVILQAVKVVKAAGKLIKGLVSKPKPEEKTPHEDDPAKAAKIEAGLVALDAADAQYVKDGGIERADAEKVAATVKKEHPVFESITVVDGGESWDYEYVASPRKSYKGAHKGSGILKIASVKVDDRDLERVEKARRESGLSYQAAVMATVVAGRGPGRLGRVGQSLEDFAEVPIATTLPGAHRPSSQSEARLNVDKGMRTRIGDDKVEVVPEARMEVLKPRGGGEVSRVAAVEATLVEDFHEKVEFKDRFAVHKVSQFLQTIDSLLTKYGPDVPIRYYFLCPNYPTEETKDYMVGIIKERGAKNIRLIWLRVKTT
jgi:hypothetical protein